MTFEDLVSALREIEGLKDLGNEHSNFHFRSRPFLHFHENERGPYADVRFGTGDFEPVWAATPAERAELLKRVRRHVRALERSRKMNRTPRSGRGSGAVQHSIQDIMIRIETDDFEAWKAWHYPHTPNWAAFGITDGPAYQDIDNPEAALFHIKTDDMERVMQWFKTDTFKEATRLAKVTGCTFFLAEPRA